MWSQKDSPAPTDFLQDLQQFDTFVIVQNNNGNNHRYAYARAWRGDKDYFLKHALGPDEVSGLEREVHWADFMCHIQKKYPQYTPRPIKIIEIIQN